MYDVRKLLLSVVALVGMSTVYAQTDGVQTDGVQTYGAQTDGVQMAGAQTDGAQTDVVQMAGTQMGGHQWTLKECIDYAEQHSIEIWRAKALAEQAKVEVLQNKAEWLPSLSASTSHRVLYTPFLKASNGVDIDKVNYNGSYGVNANWTVWNGNQTANNIRLAKLASEQSELQNDIFLNKIKEQATQLYVQILYTEEALKVNRELLEQDRTLYNRGEELLKQGQIAKYELLELQTQVANGEYDIVNTQTQIELYKLQMMDLINLPDDVPFDIVPLTISDQQALAAIPSTDDVYQQALTTRPEIRDAELAIKKSELSYSIAKAGYHPTVDLTAGVGSNYTSATHNDYFTQMKRNFDASVGVNVSVPILDNRRTKSNVQKADISRTIAKLDKEDVESELYYSIANYRLQAVNNQQKFQSGLARLKYNKENYNAIYEKAQIGTMNIVETFNARTNLLNAQQDVLQSKYLTIYNMQMLRLYSNLPIEI